MLIKNITESSEMRANIDILVKVDYCDRKVLLFNPTFIAKSDLEHIHAPSVYRSR